jgi:hypothetical protein
VFGDELLVGHIGAAASLSDMEDAEVIGGRCLPVARMDGELLRQTELTDQRSDHRRLPDVVDVGQRYHPMVGRSRRVLPLGELSIAAGQDEAPHVRRRVDLVWKLFAADVLQVRAELVPLAADEHAREDQRLPVVLWIEEARP